MDSKLNIDIEKFCQKWNTNPIQIKELFIMVGQKNGIRAVAAEIHKEIK